MTRQASATTSSATQLGSNASAPVKQGSASAPDWTATASVVSPSVVSITATSSQGGGQGSGVVIDKTHVLTNNHVVSGAEKLTVTMSDGRTYDAEVRGTDPSTDLAVITVKNAPSDMTPISIGNSDKIAVGDPVMAVGNPLGLAGTVTTGIVSALNRPVTTEAESDPQADPNGQTQTQSETVVTNAIQTSAMINPGNSGGALVNASGQLIGINSAIASLGSSSGGQSGSIGIGFAIPVNEATSIAKQLIDNGVAAHAYLGVTPQDGSASDGSATRAGAEVTSVGDDTPASKAGLKEGDVIVAVNGERGRLGRLPHRPRPREEHRRRGHPHRPARRQERRDQGHPGGQAHHTTADPQRADEAPEHADESACSGACCRPGPMVEA